MQPNGSVAYTITVSNAGPSDAPTVIVSDYLSESMLGAITSASLGTPALENGATDTGATLGASFPYTLSDTVDLAAPVSGSPNSGGWVQYVISATISASAAGTLANTASVSVAGTGVTDTGTTPVTDNDTLAKCDLVWSLSGQKTAVAGHDVIYQINVSNYGPGAAQTVTITDTLPAGMTYFSATGSNLTMGLAKTVGSVVVFSGTMAVGASETIAIDATVSSSVASGKTLTNSVTVSSGAQLQTNNGKPQTGPGPLTFTTQVNANGASLVPDMLPGMPTGTMDLVITDGPAASNMIQVSPATGGYAVSVDGHAQGTFAATGRIIVYGSGNDYEWISSSIKLSAWLYGGSGTDHLDGGAGNNVIIGGPGTNYISGGAGWNLLIGGGGGKAANYIYGTTGNNIEISGTTSYDASNSVDQAALNAILQEWANTKDIYSVRVDKITDTGGYSLSANGSIVYLNSSARAGLPSTIQRVAAYEYLYGSSSGQNLFFATETGIATDRDYVSGANNNLSAHDWLELS